MNYMMQWFPDPVRVTGTVLFYRNTNLFAIHCDENLNFTHEKYVQ